MRLPLRNVNQLKKLILENKKKMKKNYSNKKNWMKLLKMNLNVSSQRNMLYLGP